MKIFKAIYIAWLLLTYCSSWAQHSCEMEFYIKNDTLYKQGEKTPFSGEYKEYYFDNLKAIGMYLNGLKNGEFTFYSRYPNNYPIDSIVNFKFGKRDGIKKGFDSLGYTEYLENYLNDSLNGDCYYWTKGGQIDEVITYEKGRKIKFTSCKKDSTIHLIKYSIVGEKNGILSRSLFALKDTLEVKLVNINNQEPYDTIPLLKQYKIISFSYYIVYDDSAWDFKSPIVISKLDFIRNKNFKIEIFDLLVENPCGQRYYLPTQVFKTQY